MVTFMRYDGRSAFSISETGNVNISFGANIRRCIGSSIVYLRVPDEEDSRVLLDATDVSRSRV